MLVLRSSVSKFFKALKSEMEEFSAKMLL
uniref:Uncharacterized protein n=1 Tax=Rhizophora mucronata TaxID=61149 RepID=A0A2P2MD30_RHIMU